jgi:hypothetical protein
MRTQPGLVVRILTTSAAAIAAFTAPGLAQEEHGWAPVPGADRGPDLSEEQRREIEAELDRNAAALEKLGLLEVPVGVAGTHVMLDWPLLAPTIRDPGYHRIWAYVDHNPSFPNALLDYNCGNRTYDTDAGYNHQGTDYLLWPFAWLRLDQGRVQAVAAAAGTILGKADRNPDHSCVNDPALPWNAVYLQHADGSRTWYGHLQIGSLTSKPVGATVAAGEYLGLVGSSGNTSAPHLHFEVYDSIGALNDPFQGPCNTWNATSWWSSQRPYYDSAVNRVAIGFSTPVFPDCPTDEIPNEAADYNPGDRAVFIAYYRDQLSGQTATNTIRRPDGTVFATWTDNPTVPFQGATYWYRAFSSFAASGPPGIWRYDVSYLGTTTSRHFRLSAATGSGRVPGELEDENPVRLARSGSDLALTWDASCVPSDTDYEVYEGTIGAWTSHAPRLCSTGGLTNAIITPAAESSYYLIVPTDTVHEGSYGYTGSFAERPAGASSCRAQQVGGSCPRCGDLKIESPEVCDHNLLNGQTCVTLGFAGGTLSCAPDCASFDTSNCF